MTQPDEYADFLKPPDAAFWLEPDFVLMSIVASLVNLMELPIGVTLFVNGMMLTGTLVSEREFLESLTHLFRETARDSLIAVSGEDDAALEDAFDFTALAESAMARDPDAPADADADDEFDGAAPIRFLHIKHIAVLSPQPAIAFSQSTFPYVRIRLNAIGGWMLGHAMSFDADGPGEGESHKQPPVLH